MTIKMYSPTLNAFTPTEAFQKGKEIRLSKLPDQIPVIINEMLCNACAEAGSSVLFNDIFISIDEVETKFNAGGFPWTSGRPNTLPNNWKQLVAELYQDNHWTVRIEGPQIKFSNRV